MQHLKNLNTTPAGILPLGVTVTTHPCIQRTQLPALGLLGCRTLPPHMEAEGRLTKTSGISLKKSTAYVEQNVPAFSWQCPGYSAQEGKAKQVLQTHCGDLKAEFCFETALTRLFV